MQTIEGANRLREESAWVLARLRAAHEAAARAAERGDVAALRRARDGARQAALELAALHRGMEVIERSAS